MTVNIKEALGEYCKRYENMKTTSRKLSFYPPIDITAVVLAATIEYSKKSASIAIGDSSLQYHECARMIFQNMSLTELDAMIRLNISSGDIIRFNRVSLRDHYLSQKESNTSKNVATLTSKCSDGIESEKDQMTGTFTSPRKIFTVVCDFHHSWKDPEAGSSFFRIARLCFSAQGSCNAVKESHYCRMMPAPSILEGLIRWFRDHHHNRFHEWIVSFESLVNVDMSYRRQNLNELRVPDTICDVVVYVLSVDSSKTLKNCIRPVYQSQGRKRFHWETRSEWLNLIRVAILSDASHKESKYRNSSMFLYFDKAIQKDLQKAYTKQCKILITRVVTQSCFSLFLCHGLSDIDDSTIILLPSTQTYVEMLEEGNMANVSVTERNQFEDTHELASLSPISQTFSFETSFVKGESFHRQEDTVPWKIVTSSTLVSICFDELNLSLPSTNDKYTWPCHSVLASMLVRSNIEGVGISVDLSPCDGMCQYRSATLTLSSEDNDSKETCRVKASGEVISTLCGNFHAFEILREGGSGIETSLASDVLMGLINLDVVLEWTLYRNESNDNFYCVDTVHLPSCDF